jgi:hypothetical protein
MRSQSVVPRRDRLRPTREVLGPAHPLARAAELVETFERQAGVVLAVILLAAAATALGLPLAPIVLSAALAAELALGAALALARETRTERAWEAIVAGVDVAEAARERDRLTGPKRRAELADALARALDSAEGWHQILVSSRPPEGVRALRHFAPEVRLIVAHVSDGGADVRGIALLARLLAGGYGSPLYAGDVEALHSELVRIAELVSGRAAQSRGTR